MITLGIYYFISILNLFYKIRNSFSIVESWNELYDSLKILILEKEKEEKIKNSKNLSSSSSLTSSGSSSLINKKYILVQFEIDEKNNFIKLNLKENIQKKGRKLSQLTINSNVTVNTASVGGSVVGGGGTGTSSGGTSPYLFQSSPFASNQTNNNGGQDILSSCHHYLPPTNKTIVFDDEISSIVAYTLQTNEYKNFIKKDNTTNEHSTKISLENMMKLEEKSEFKLNFKDLMNEKDIQLKRSGQDFSCICYFAKQFSSLRESFKNGEEHYLTSLSRCKSFLPTGGKSGSSFTKTW